jgi:hypothetical protein
MALRLLCRRCGELSPALDARVRALSSESLEALADALLDFRDRNDLEAWLLSVGSS